MVEFQQQNPSESASFLSHLFYEWLHRLIKHGLKKNLQESDLYRNRKDNDSEHLGDLLQNDWDNERIKKNPSLLKSIIRVFGYKCLTAFLIILFQECFVVIFQAYLIGILTGYFDNKLDENKIYAYLSASGICFTAILSIINLHIFVYYTGRLDIKLSVACCSIIYRKALKLSHSSLGKSNIGQMVNLLSNDINKFDMCFYKLAYLIVGPLQTILTIVVMYEYLDHACLAGISLILFFIPIQTRLAKVFSALRLKTAKLSDKRIHFLNELMDGLRVIKMYTWEVPFATTVEICRRKELENIKKSLLIYVIPFTTGLIFSKLQLFISLFTFLAVGGKLTARIVFVNLSLSVNLYRSIFFSFSQAIFPIAEALTSVKRIQKFLLLEEITQVTRKEITTINHVKESSVWMEKISASWNKSSVPNLKDITMEAHFGDLVIIVGPVGSGKTSLLMTMLDEIPISSGQITIKGRISYASQEPWIFRGTIKENILFGEDYHEKKYKEILYVTALEKDLNDFPDGDLTLVGERGRIMSGGQKARINLARALYRDADIYLLDDPLSAVDAPVAKHIFEKCIMNYLKNKVRILVTHQTQFLQAATKIIVLKEGNVQAIGNYKKLMMVDKNKKQLLEGLEQTVGNDLNHETVSISDVRLSNFFPNLKPYDINYFKEENYIVPKTNQLNINNYDKGNQANQERRISRLSVYIDYLNAGTGKFFQIILVLLFLMTQVLMNGSDYILAIWTNQEILHDREKNISESCKMISESINLINCTNSTLPNENEKFYIYVYSGLMIGLILSSVFTAIAYFTICIKSSVRIHNNILHSIIRTPMSFLDDNQIGKVLNRFSRDMGIIDQQLSTTSLIFLCVLINNVGMFILQVIIYPYLIIPLIIQLVLMCCVWFLAVRIAKDIRHLEGITRSPVFSHLSTSLYGLTTIRAFNAEEKFKIAFDKCHNNNTSCKFLIFCLNQWNIQKIYIISNLYLIVTIVMLFLETSSITGSEVGLCLCYGITSFFTMFVVSHMGVDMNIQLTSVERIMDYSKLPSEAPNSSAPDKRPPNDWPQKGIIHFRDVYLQYPGDNHSVLKKLNFFIKPGEKIGIVGRTGAGKSSIIAALFRMIEPTGIIFIDGIDIKEIGLHDLRSKISIIPQDPLFFSGSIRRNLDPFNKHDEESLWGVLEEVHLKDAVRILNAGLDAELTEGGSNFSVGQRQLICLARAILHRNKIIVLDEATANIDKETDFLIQKTIREKFASSTILTIAHRIQTIMDSDRILVLQDGIIEEFDEPYKLLKNINGVFYNMIKMTGEEMVKRMHIIGEEKYLKNNHKANESYMEVNSEEENP